MKRFSTRCLDEFIDKTEKNKDTEKSSPNQKTLDFLIGFSRVYHAERNIRQKVCGLIMN